MAGMRGTGSTAQVVRSSRDAMTAVQKIVQSCG
eukprot:CAMPEP_0183444604 /NCGR_PEP_ID=MMETSP0370-20130417/95636_1 /TAXON_ID=268820 /ORGANISM="Peridinium aciculiferum, Strain PAER-2" /LENGTH=32 /DNA_ID= /DNA_START= /DNA_END= /DNA_ORIENTATION=